MSLQSLPYRNKQRQQNRQWLHAALESVPGIRPFKSYAKAEDGGFYSGWRLFYAAEELGGLPFSKYLAALQAEGVPVTPYRDQPEHLRPLIQRGFDLYGRGRGPINPGSCDYQKGDLPVAEEMLASKLMLLYPYIDPVEGLLPQIARAFEKVARHYQALL